METLLKIILGVVSVLFGIVLIKNKKNSDDIKKLKEENDVLINSYDNLKKIYDLKVKESEIEREHNEKVNEKIDNVHHGSVSDAIHQLQER